MDVNVQPDRTETSYYLSWASRWRHPVVALASVQHGWGGDIVPLAEIEVRHIGARRHELIAACLAHLLGHEPDDALVYTVSETPALGLRITERDLRRIVDAGVQGSLL